MGKRVAQEEIKKQLRHFGLLENEVEVYLFTVRTGTCPVSSIARKLGTNRMNVYRTLKTLQDKGLIESTVERPTKFVALPIANFLDKYIEESRKNAIMLESTRSDIIDYCESLRKAEALAEEPKFRIVQGRKHVYDQTQNMLNRTKTETCIIQTKNGLYRFIYSGIDDKLKALHDKGVGIRILSEVDESGVEAVKNYLSFSQVRHASIPTTMRLVLVDDAEALITFSAEDSMSLTSEKDLAMWIRAPDYVKTMKVFFDAMWKNGVIARQRLASITARQNLVESLERVRRTLTAEGWVATIPGKLTGESGVEHTFDFTAKYPGDKSVSIVADLLAEHGSQQILAFSLKTLDAKPTAQLLVAREPPEDEEFELAARHGAKLIYASRTPQVAARIVAEANKALKQRLES